MAAQLSKDAKIVITGAAGLVGQNLILMLLEQGYCNIVAIDKHEQNTALLCSLHPEMKVIFADVLIENAEIRKEIGHCDILICLHAQISGKTEDVFWRNNVEATKKVLEYCQEANISHFIQASSSVVISVADDFYTRTKRAQEELILKSNQKYTILRPALMFGWFDRKHLGWLSRFMQKIPVFPLPGKGNQIRQPVYVRDFCKVIISAMEIGPKNEIHNIIGREQIPYGQIIRTIKKIKKLRTVVVDLPYSLFYWLLRLYAFFVKNPPFTADQLEALCAGDMFPLDPWWEYFSVTTVPFEQAMQETLCDQQYSKYVLRF